MSYGEYSYDWESKNEEVFNLGSGIEKALKAD